MLIELIRSTESANEERSLLRTIQDESKDHELCWSRSQCSLVQKAIKFISNLHKATLQEYETNKFREPKSIYEGRFTLIVLGLLDFISYEGIIPFLSEGVGLPEEQRPKPVLKAISQRKEEKGEEGILGYVVNALFGILDDEDEGIAPIIRERSLADLLAGLCELSIGPRAMKNAEGVASKVDRLLNEYALILHFILLLIS